ncbi:alpha-L-fucosidase-domain-containing protein [Halteromyces radiatus]|uniref:alpha-L-fucosidase-domain-containing protein n=1 Tax=Halteromyces radiatus TaxID=101107 RepID=UPI002220074C|nr:alpha-L-fucosidase-domain-containing protein [Halteromyces radiatus]KAI8078705.1 alpha-L-fucosidase-domain-containing protein [Halteromyces radiatus]
MSSTTYTTLDIPTRRKPFNYSYYLYGSIIFILIIINIIIYYYLLFHPSPDPSPIFIDLTKVVNNRGFGIHDGNFDGLDQYFTCSILTQQQPSMYIGNIPFQPIHSSNKFNDATARGQVITLPKRTLGALYLLASASHGPVTTSHLAVTYQDGSISSTILDIPDWQVAQPEHIHRLDRTSCQINTQVNGSLYLVPLYVDPAKTVSHLTLPYTYPVGSFAQTLHIFAITAFPASTSHAVHIISATPTLQWIQQESSQWIKVRIHNISPYCLDNVIVEINSNNHGKQENDIQTIRHGHLQRFASGQIAVVKVAVRLGSSSSLSSESTLISVTSKSRMGIQTTVAQEVLTLDLGGISNFTEDESSLGHHQAPDWLRGAKFGIFIHWGVYSVPSWSKVGESYAEWYWWQLMQRDSPTFEYHRQTYGEHFEYDDFIDQWNTSSFDAYQWLDVVDKANAKYFVFTTKHHDGIALFDTKVSQRSSVHLKPQRDFVRELMDVSQTSYPHLKRGLYFSLPEWYHPKYHDDWLGWQGPPRNAYNHSIIPYTASTPINDFVNELQVPQFLELINNYAPDIIWCDIGGINNSTAWQAEYFNQAKAQGRQVAINDRCGNSVSDFTTVEYQDVSNIPPRFWEATRGVDPYSFGYNHETLPEQYASTTSLIHELIHVVARGGNFLLNIGPDASGRIPEPMRDRLLAIGKWLDQVGPSIFEATDEPYWVTPQDTATPSQTILFTYHRLGSSFYIFCLEKPISGRVIIKSPIPLHPRAFIRLMGDPLHESLDWRVWDNGRLIIEVPDRVVQLGQHAWVFELRFP